jgi:hypothetical protein
MIKNLHRKYFPNICLFFDSVFESGLLFKLTGKTSYYGNPFNYEDGTLTFKCFTDTTSHPEEIATSIIDFVTSTPVDSCKSEMFQQFLHDRYHKLVPLLD